MSWGPTGATRQRSVLVNSVRQNTLRTRKVFPEKTTTCIWLTLSYEAWYCTRLLKKICTLVPNVTISWTIKDEMSFMTHNLRLSFEYSHFADTPGVKQKAKAELQTASLLLHRSLIRILIAVKLAKACTCSCRGSYKPTAVRSQSFVLCFLSRQYNS